MKDRKDTLDFFPDEVDLRLAGYRNGSAVFQLLTRYRYHLLMKSDDPEELSGFVTITVPAGFITDGASIPSIFWEFLSPYGEYFAAALIHDFLYSKLNQKYTREESDKIFLEAMDRLGISWIKRHTIYRAVRMFGWMPFNKNRKP